MTTKDVISLSFDGGTTEYLIKDSTARTNIGDLSNLTTTAKDNLVAAINEAATTGGGGSYVLPPATTETLGGVKPDGTTITITNDGTITAVGGGGSVTVDSELSTTSENPVQNKVITNTINAKEQALYGRIWSNVANPSAGYFQTKYTYNNGSFAQIWNESDGGGSLVFDKTDNVKSYVGTNLVEGEGADAGAVNVQIYSFDDTTKNGVRINVNANKAFYVKGAKGQGNPAGREIATIEDLPVDVSEEVTALTETVEGLSETVTGYDESISTLTDSVATQGGNITAVLSRLELVEDKLAAQAKTNVETEVVEDTITLNDNTVDYIVRGSFTERSVITGKSVTVKDSTVEAAVLNLTATDDLDLKGTDISGTYDRSTQGNSMVNIHSDGYVTIKNCTISADGYNAIEIGLTKGEAKNVLIDNVRFEGTFSNNAISIFGTEDDAVITISNCTFENVSNVFRISNRTNVGCTINIVNCSCNSWEPDGDYAGMILCQDYTSATAEDAEANNLFSPAKIKINIQNFIKPDGTRLATPEDYSEVCGSGDENQILYVYYNKGGLVAYDETKYPALTIS